MPNITISIPKELYDRIKRHPEIRWSVVVREFLKEFLSKIEGVDSIPAEELLKKIGLKDELEAIPDDVSMEFGEEAVKKREKRVIRY